MWLFDVLVFAHIVVGTIGLATLWVPVVGKKGTERHKRWGHWFAHSLLATGLIAVGISLTTLTWPLETHPFFDNPALIRGLFGWMMLYLAILTIMLSRYGLWCVQNRNAHDRNKSALNLSLQVATFATALNCFWHGLQLQQPIMLGIAVVGVTAAILNLRFILQSKPAVNEWLIQHTRGLVGAGISVYTAFFAFGAVNLMPRLAFNPLLWATPTIFGVAVLLYHQARIEKKRKSGLLFWLWQLTQRRQRMPRSAR